jgi:hypothetical protein
MLTALPALLLLIGFPHFGLKPSRTASPADSLPPPWKNASRLAVEDQFVLGALRPLRLHPPGLKLNPDPRSLHVTMDADSATVSTSTRLGEIALGPGAARPLSAFARESGRLTFERLWFETSQRNLNVKGTGSGRGGSTSGLSFKLPSPLPARVQNLLGPGGPALNVSGSENIRLSGQSDWSNQQMGLLGQKRSLFPTLNMQQDLDIHLEGQLSDRIKVNLLQNSATQIPLANRIAINYRGGEDDLVQALDLGNTNLTLPGTQYVSYSGRNEGLFGVKTSLRYGALDLTVLASKQEGKSERASYSGGASKQNQTLNDFDYVPRTYFFLYDPNHPDPRNPEVGALDIEDASIVLYRDNADYTANVSTVRGRARMDPTLGPGTSPDTAAVLGLFTPLTAGADKDYEILRDVYGPNYKVIRLRRQMMGAQRLAVTYRARPAGSTGPYEQVGSLVPVDDPDGVPTIQMKLLRAPANLIVPDSTGRGFETDTLRAPFNATRELELRNFYQLAGQRIDPSTIKINVRQGYSDPPQYSEPVAPGVPYIEMLGLDNFDESGGSAVRGAHDGKVDGTVASSNTRAFIDFEDGILFLPDLRPFAPRFGGLAGQAARPFDQAIGALLSRRDTFDISRPDPHTSSGGLDQAASNPAIYDDYNPRRDLASTYFIDVEFTAAQAQGEIMLGRGNLLEGSEVVTVNGEQWVRDKDYTIDYDLGRLTLKRQLPTGGQLNVNYSYAPLFQQAGRTLVGSAFRLEGREKSLGGAFMYESKGAQDLRPRLGEEPSRSLITDLNTEWTFHPTWMTRMVDRLPGVRTTTASDFHVQAEMGLSFPNPNTRNEVFIDDMEGVRDAVSLTMAQERWHLASVPRLEVAPGVSVPLTDPAVEAGFEVHGLRNAEMHWYSPPNFVKERDLKPNLSDAQGARNPHQVLCLSVPRRPSTGAISDSTRLWAGVDYMLDPVGLDLSRSQFIELWVNDFNDQHAGDGKTRVRGRHVKLHVDLGAVSEDRMPSPDQPPNGLLDTEDKARDNVLTVEEDTGLDGLMNPDSGKTHDLVNSTTADPEGDDFHPPNDIVTRDEAKSVDPRNWVSVNGTEGNRTINPVPDTEDQNLNGALDTSDDYLEYTIDLGEDFSALSDTSYLVTDVHAAFPTTAGDDGWRRFRIPINDSRAVKFGNPNLAMAQRVRVWLQGVVEPDESTAEIRKPLLMLGGLEIVGSRWQQAELAAAVSKAGTTMTLNAVNSLDNADVYVPPFDPGQTRNGNQELTRREQSMSMEFTNLKGGATLETFKTFSLDENYSRYGKLAWYAAAFDVRDSAKAVCTSTPGLYYFVRFASDEQGRNYYEYRATLPANSSAKQISWNEIRLQLTSLSNLKLNPDFQKADPNRYGVAGGAPGESLFVIGRPSFTRLRRISFGLLNQGGASYSSGQLWFDEIRATDVAKDVDHAQRVQVNGQLANLMSYNLAWNGRGADFLSVGESRGSGSSFDQFSWSTAIQPYRFFEQARISLPINLAYSRNSSRPRFSAGDDIIRTGALEAASETRNETRSFGTGYSRSWSERSNPFLRYTLGGITAAYNQSLSNNRSPYSVDSSNVKSASVSYLITPRKLLALGIPLSKARFYLLPERAYWNYSVSSTHTVTYDRVGALRDSLRKRSDVTGRSAFVNFGADSRPVDLFHHHVEGVRNMVLPVRNDGIGFINLGRVTSWRQNMDAHYIVGGGSWLRPSLNWSSNYNQNNGPELSRDLSVRSISNGQALSMTMDLPFARLGEAKAARRPVRSGRERPGAPPDSGLGAPSDGSDGAPPEGPDSPQDGSYRGSPDGPPGAPLDGPRGTPPDGPRGAPPDGPRGAPPDGSRGRALELPRGAPLASPRGAPTPGSRIARSDSVRVASAGSARAVSPTGIRVAPEDLACFARVDSARVALLGSARVALFDLARVTFFDLARGARTDSTRVARFGSARTTLFDVARVARVDSARVALFGSARVALFDIGRIARLDRTLDTRSDSARVALFGSARVALFGLARVEPLDDARVSFPDVSREALRDSSQVAAAQPHRGGYRLFEALGGMRPSLSWRRLLASLGTISTDAGVTRASGYSRITGTPGFAYLFGFSSRFDSTRMRPMFGNGFSTSTDLRMGVRTRLRLPFGSSANTRFDFTSRVYDNSGMKNRTQTRRFPDVDLEYGQLTSVLRFDRVLNNPQLRTTYGRSQSTDFANNRPRPSGRSSSSEWRPLIGLSGSLKSGTRIEFKTERRVTETENLLVGHTVTTNRISTTDFSLNRSYSKGQKVKILGKEKTVSSTVSVGLSGQYESQTGETNTYADASRDQVTNVRFPTSESRLSLNGTGSYSFSTNVTGNLALGYGENNDRQRNFKRKNVRVELRAQFTF